MATKTSLKQIRIREFRGSAGDFSLAFDSSKPLTLVYGENGSGKTTICDAFDFIGNGKVGSLADRGLGQLHPFWPTLGKTSGNILVELSADGSKWTAQAKGKEVTVTPVKSSMPRIEVLRRSSILKLVQDDPKERYSALKPFIDISKVEQAEAALRTQIKDSKTVQNEAAARLGENAETLARVMAEAGAKEKDPIAWAVAAIAKPPVDNSAVASALRQASQSIGTLLAQSDGVAAATAEVSTAEAARATAAQSYENAIGQSNSADAAFVQILTTAQQHFKQHPVGDSCPLCESKEKVDGLAERVGERLAKFEAVRIAQQAVTSTERTLQAKKSSLDSAVSRAMQHINAAVSKVSVAQDEWRKAHATALGSLDSAKSSDNFSLIDFEGLKACVVSADEIAAQLEENSAWFKTAKTTLEQYDKNVARQKTVSSVLPRLEKVLYVCEKQRKKFLDEILGGIAQEVGRLYEIIHPDEGLNKVSLKLAPNKQGSLDLNAEFLGQKDQPPPAYFSESHLDSLGLCIFLALAGRDFPKSTIVVMDDVLGSIDEPHVDRLIQMLYDESKVFKHTIITTHYQPWKEKFKWGWLKNGQCELLELGVWTPKTGLMAAGRSQSPLFDLRNYLAATPPSLQSACATAGVMLEAICDYLTSLYECDVPRRKGKLTLGDLLPRVAEKRFSDALRVEIKNPDGTYTTVSLGDKFIKLRDMAQLRNIFGCHYNDLAHVLPQKDALEFASLVHEVGSALICDEEGWPGSDKSGSYWATKDETRRLHPLKKPK